MATDVLFNCFQVPVFCRCPPIVRHFFPLANKLLYYEPRYTSVPNFIQFEQWEVNEINVAGFAQGI
jgi:hypothetical protein